MGIQADQSEPSILGLFLSVSVFSFLCFSAPSVPPPLAPSSLWTDIRLSPTRVEGVSLLSQCLQAAACVLPRASPPDTRPRRLTPRFGVSLLREPISAEPQPARCPKRGRASKVTVKAQEKRYLGPDSGDWHVTVFIFPCNWLQIAWASHSFLIPEVTT